jgi:hypothetical protein
MVVEMKTNLIVLTEQILILLALMALFCPLPAKAQDADFGNRMKHGLVGAGISGGLSAYCKAKLKHKWFCFWGGVIPTIIGAAIFEGVQKDYVDAGGDIVAGGVGAAIGSSIAIAIEF